MISLAEQNSGFNSLAKQFKKLAKDLADMLDIQPEPLKIDTTADAFSQGMDPGSTYIVKGGMLGLKCHGKKLFTFDEGDIILPDMHGDEENGVRYHADAPVLLQGYNTLELVKKALANEESARIWTRLLLTLQGLQVRMLAAATEEEAQTTPGFAYFKEGDTIISQGDPADYVFSLFEGSADVLVDDVVVGEVKEGEVIGALAVLTHQPRSATVRAKSRCSVVKVPKNQFKSLIRGNPTMIHGLLTDMARQIMKLNTQVVELSDVTT